MKGMEKIIKQVTERFGYNPFEEKQDSFLEYINSQIRCRCTNLPPTKPGETIIEGILNRFFERWEEKFNGGIK